MTQDIDIAALEQELLGIDDTDEEAQFQPEPDTVDDDVVESDTEDDQDIAKAIEADELLLIALRRAMADVMKEESDKDRKTLEEALKKQQAIDGKQTLTITMPNGDKVATMSETTTEVWEYNFPDKDAFNAWFMDTYPDYTEEKVVEVTNTYDTVPSGIEEVDALLNKGIVEVTLKTEEKQQVIDTAFIPKVLDDMAIEDGQLLDEDGNTIPGVVAESKTKVTKGGFRFTGNTQGKRDLVAFALDNGLKLTTENMMPTMALEAGK